jgi:hypothetical protein
MKKARLFLGSYKKRILMIGLILISVVYVGNSNLKADWTTGDTSNTFTMGNVGIGTSSPDSNLVIYGNNPIINLKNTASDYGSGGKLVFGHNQDGSSTPIGEMTGFLTNGGGTFRSGYLTIGTSFNGVLLKVISLMSTSAGGSLVIENNSYNYGSGGQLVFGHNQDGSSTPISDIRGVLTNGSASGRSGYLSFRTTCNNSIGERMLVTDTGLSVNGNVYASGTITSAATISAANYSCSDVRFKKSIEPISNSLEKICSLTGVTYQWKKDEFMNRHFDDRRQIGFIAQEVEKVFPELVYTDKEGYKSVSYDKFTAIIVEALKEQKKNSDEKIASLDKEVSQLKAENDALKNKVASLDQLERRMALIESKMSKSYVSSK